MTTGKTKILVKKLSEGRYTKQTREGVDTDTRGMLMQGHRRKEKVLS
jgi:hypothetical protein